LPVADNHDRCCDQTHMWIGTDRRDYLFLRCPL
jgi:hypothetical protein